MSLRAVFISSSFAIISLCLLSCAKPLHESKFRSTPVVADGDISEWEVPLDYYDLDTRLNYTISNDKEKLYLCIRAAEKITQQKILRGGMTIKIGIHDKKQDYASTIIYPNPPKEKAAKQDEDREDEMPAGKHGRGKPLGYLGDITLSGFKPPIGNSIPQPNDYGITIALKRDSNGVLIYEAIIPFATFYKAAISNSDCKKEWSLSINLNSIASNGQHHRDPNSEMSAPGGMGGGGMGGMGGGGMGRGGMGGGMGRGGGGGHRGGGGGAGSGTSEYEAGSLKVPFRPVLK